MRNSYLPLFCFLLVFSVVPASANEPQTVSEKLSYSAGYQIGDHFRKQKLKVRTDMVMLGLESAVRGERPVLTKGEMRVLLKDPKKALYEELSSFRQENREKGKAFLDQIGKQEGTVILPSGVHYKIIRPGTGKQADLKDTVRIHYQGKTLEDTVFADTYKNGLPDEIEVETMVPGIAEALQLMRVGGEWEIYLPEDLAYGSNGPLADKTLVYRMELLDVLSAE